MMEEEDRYPTETPIWPTMCSRLRLRAGLVPKHFFIRGLSVVDILEFCLLVLGNLTGPGSLPQGRKLLLPLLQDGGDSTRRGGSPCFHKSLSVSGKFWINIIPKRGLITSSSRFEDRILEKEDDF